jgi:hypothetical protein
MEELRLAAGLRLAARLETGANLVPELAGLTRPRAPAGSVIALYRPGRQSVALAVFDSHRRGLVEETDLEAEPADLQRRISPWPALIPMTPLPPPSTRSAGGGGRPAGVASRSFLAQGPPRGDGRVDPGDHAHPLQGAPT